MNATKIILQGIWRVAVCLLCPPMAVYFVASDVIDAHDEDDCDAE